MSTSNFLAFSQKGSFRVSLFLALACPMLALASEPVPAPITASVTKIVAVQHRLDFSSSCMTLSEKASDAYGTFIGEMKKRKVVTVNLILEPSMRCFDVMGPPGSIRAARLRIAHAPMRDWVKERELTIQVFERKLGGIDAESLGSEGVIVELIVKRD